MEKEKKTHYAGHKSTTSSKTTNSKSYNRISHIITYSPAYRRPLFSFSKCKYWVDKPYYPYITMR